MTTNNGDNPVDHKREIARLVSAAGEFGEPDTWAGKRSAPRVAEGMQLEVTTNPGDPSAAWAVSMQDVSHTGVAFWSKREIRPRSGIYVRQFSPGTEYKWIPACVKHSTVGIRGSLIGAEFEAASGAASAPGSAQGSTRLPQTVGVRQHMQPR